MHANMNVLQKDERRSAGVDSLFTSHHHSSFTVDCGSVERPI